MVVIMQIYLISVGNRMPLWVKQGYEEYARRLPKDCALILKEITPGKRVKNFVLQRLLEQEGERMVAAIPADALRVTLDLSGKAWSTRELSTQLQGWRENSRSVALLIGGPDGLAENVRNTAQQSWCLSNLTFPHPLVRIIVAEQLYRAWSLLCHHPYHR
jgi:23S rRNA (pseudouridine1915-N3)-methyltransferase